MRAGPLESLCLPIANDDALADDAAQLPGSGAVWRLEAVAQLGAGGLED